MDDRRCARCGGVKPRSVFYVNRGWRDGLHPYCKTCLNEYQRYRRLRIRDRTDPRRRRWTKWSIKHDYFREIDQPLAARRLVFRVETKASY